MLLQLRLLFAALGVHHTRQLGTFNILPLLARLVVSRSARSVLRCRNFTLLGMLLRVDSYSYSPEYSTTAVQIARVDFPPLAKAEGLPISREFYVYYSMTIRHSCN